MRHSTFVIVFSLAAAGCARDRPELRIEKYLGVKASTNPTELRKELLAAIPVGTSEQQLYDLLNESGAAKDPFASWYAAGKDDVVVFRTGKDMRHSAIVYTEYAVFFQLGADRKLHNIQVKEWLTGP